VNNKKSPINAKGNAHQRCMFESPVNKIYSRQKVTDDRRLIICSVLLVLARRHDLPRSANAVSTGNRKFSPPSVI